jgi:hypothetical protein
MGTLLHVGGLARYRSPCMVDLLCSTVWRCTADFFVPSLMPPEKQKSPSPTDSELQFACDSLHTLEKAIVRNWSQEVELLAESSSSEPALGGLDSEPLHPSDLLKTQPEVWQSVGFTKCLHCSY